MLAHAEDVVSTGKDGGKDRFAVGTAFYGSGAIGNDGGNRCQAIAFGCPPVLVALRGCLRAIFRFPITRAEDALSFGQQSSRFALALRLADFQGFR